MKASTRISPILALCLSLCGSGVNATPLVVDFNGLAPAAIPMNGNFVSQGIAFSPNCHQHIATTQSAPSPSIGEVPAWGGQWLGFDPSGCQIGDRPPSRSRSRSVPEPSPQKLLVNRLDAC
ncbi:hypothetical protein [Massilia cavernae]|uniref:hypothetical protein n=1 Tax=Massilia cavernae TaxID=2320864 RepID=UPI0011C3FBF1|nr:hypothetical protein [Massilia cavernae]